MGTAKKPTSAVERNPDGTYRVRIPPRASIEASAPLIRGRLITLCTLWNDRHHILGPVKVDLSDLRELERVQMIAGSQNGRMNWIGGLSALGLAIHEQAPLTSTAETVTTETNRWPVLAKEAMYGLAGEVVEIISPHTEADPVALLVQILLAFGNLIDRQPHCRAEADSHPLNEFAVLVGLTAKGRKGSSSGHVEKLFEGVDSSWTRQCIQWGLSSGEGLIWAVRDAIIKKREVIDEGVLDKRLFVLEAEFASTLRVLGREGNTLSTIIRQAWDGKKLASMTKNSPGKSTGAHVSIVGHITRDELLRYLGTTEATNGFGNRFLWCCVRRSKTLPEGGRLQPFALDDVVRRLKEVVDGARKDKEITRDQKARAVWREVYPALSEGRPGLLGAMTSRAEAHVMRLSALYALLDGSSIVTDTHINAALALWDYCEDSARFIFGDALGDPLADNIRDLLRANPGGLTNTEISYHFQRNKSSEQIQSALHLLQEHGYVTPEERETGGRKATVWKFSGTN
jgi:Protein of unknown function (DUF3987)